MLRQITQFDNDRTTASIATPTCSSCCCCCCCIATMATTSMILAQRTYKEAERNNVKSKATITVMAALFFPVVAGIIWAIMSTVDKFTRTCTVDDYQYTYCTNRSSGWLLPIALIVPVLVLTYIYVRIKMRYALLRAIIVTAIISALFAAEFIAGFALIITGVGAIVYIIGVPFVIAAAQGIYWKSTHWNSTPPSDIPQPPGSLNA